MFKVKLVFDIGISILHEFTKKATARNVTRRVILEPLSNRARQSAEVLSLILGSSPGEERLLGE